MKPHFKRLLCKASVFAVALIFQSCSHDALRHMAEEEARRDYLGGHGNRQTYEEELREIESCSDAWEQQQNRKKDVVPERSGED
jgi:hypothetical protein